MGVSVVSPLHVYGQPGPISHDEGRWYGTPVDKIPRIILTLAFSLLF